ANCNKSSQNDPSCDTRVKSSLTQAVYSPERWRTLSRTPKNPKTVSSFTFIRGSQCNWIRCRLSPYTNSCWSITASSLERKTPRRSAPPPWASQPTTTTRCCASSRTPTDKESSLLLCQRLQPVEFCSGPDLECDRVLVAACAEHCVNITPWTR